MSVLVIGALTGLVYAVFAAGLVLVYRATRVINFAHGDIGALCSAILAKLVLDNGWPYVLALVAVTLLGAGTGAAIELAIVRRLFDRPRVVLLVATIGVAQLLFYVTAVSIDIERAAPYPVPIARAIEIGGVRILGDGLLALAVMPAIVVGLGVLLNATPYGIAIRSSAENADAARLAAINVKRVSTLVWTLAGAIAAVSIVVAAPLRGDLPGLPLPIFGPSLLLRALAAALVGRMVSLPLTLVGGIGVGVAEAVLLNNFAVGEANLALAGLVVVLVLWRGRAVAATEDASSFALSPKIRAIPSHLASVRGLVDLPRIVRYGGIAVGLALPWVFGSAARVQTFSQMLLFALVALSVTVLTGWAGQLSLGQFAFVGCGAAGTTALVARGVPFGPAVAYATVGTVLVALVVGLPALRVRGLFLAVTTIGFAVAASSWLIPRLLGASTGGVATVPRGVVGPFHLADQRSYYYLCLGVLVAAMFAVSRLRSSGIGRALIAVRSNEQCASAFTVSAVRAKLIAFAVSGGLAAVAGGLLAGLAVQVRADAFTPDQSLRVVAMAIIGGLGSVPGAVLGAIWVVGLPAIFGATAEVRALTTAPALLVLLLYLPGGLMQVVYRMRDVLIAAVAARVEGVAAPAPLRTGGAAERLSSRPRAGDRSVVDGDVALRVRNVTVRFGGLTAVDGVDVDVNPGEIVGLIGSNGAGKSTLMNAISGFVPATGEISILGVDVGHLPSAARAHAGLGRAFQDARLFGDLTVRESVKVALEAREPSEVVPSLLSLPPSRRAERRKRVEADDIVGLLGLGRYADSYITELSTGTRRIAELACLLALDARVLLLDEPTAGVAQRETEAFGPLIGRIRRELDASVLIIEHDIPLVMSVSDRVYCMEAGKVIASGRPHEVRSDPAVIASYLGTDERAIRRSGATRRRRTKVRS